MALHRIDARGVAGASLSYAQPTAASSCESRWTRAAEARLTRRGTSWTKAHREGAGRPDAPCTRGSAPGTDGRPGARKTPGRPSGRWAWGRSYLERPREAEVGSCCALTAQEVTGRGRGEHRIAALRWQGEPRDHARTPPFEFYRLMGARDRRGGSPTSTVGYAPCTLQPSGSG